MAIPGYQEFMYPFLNHLKDGKEHSLQSMYKSMAEHFHLTEELRSILFCAALTYVVFSNQ